MDNVFVLTGVKQVVNKGEVGMKLHIEVNGKEQTPFTVFVGDVLVLK